MAGRILISLAILFLCSCSPVFDYRRESLAVEAGYNEGYRAAKDSIDSTIVRRQKNMIDYLISRDPYKLEIK